VRETREQCIGPGHTRTLEDPITLGRKRQLLGHERTAANKSVKENFFSEAFEPDARARD